MDKKEKVKETVQPEKKAEQVIPVEQVTPEMVNSNDSVIETLNQQIEALKQENQTLKESLEIMKGIREEQDAKIAELTAEESDTSTFRKVDKEGNVKIKILLSPAGKFLLPYNVGQIVSHEANQADEMVELKYAEYVK